MRPGRRSAAWRLRPLDKRDLSVSWSPGTRNMSLSFAAIGRRMVVWVRALIWGTRERRWTTYWTIGGLVAASLFMPAIGIAVLGTAFAGWWLAVLVITLISGMFGNRLVVELDRRAAARGDEKEL